MTTIPTPATGELRLALSDIRVRENVRELDSEHVENLAQSIALRGLLVPTIRFTEADVDQARAAGVLIEIERSSPIITDRDLYHELCKQAVARTLEDVRVRVAQKGKAKRSGAATRERTPREELDVEHHATLREITRQAHGTNLDLGAALLTQLATMATDDMDVARFFVLCERRHNANYADLVTMPTRSPGPCG